MNYYTILKWASPELRSYGICAHAIPLLSSG